MLEGNSNRRANDSIRGFVYQLWVAVDAWIDLKSDEILYVEGAEDIDILENDNAQTIQVKDNKASGKLSLGNAKAIEAINNFWELKCKNEGIKIHFKYLTTAEIAFEKSGDKKCKGIEVWDLCRKEKDKDLDAKITYIKNLLLLKPKHLSSSLRDFLEASNNAQIKAELIDEFEWIYNQPELENIVEQINSKILTIGGQDRLSVPDAKTLANTLYMIIQNMAISKKPQPLTHKDFLEHFDNASLQLMSRQDMQDMIAVTVHETLKNLGLTEQSDIPLSSKLSIRSIQENAVAYIQGRSEENSKQSQKALSELKEGKPQSAYDVLGSDISGIEKGIKSTKDKLSEQQRQIVKLSMGQGALVFHSDTKKALQAYRRALKYYPENTHALSMLGYLLIRTGDLDGAEEAFDKISNIGGTNLALQAITIGDIGLVYQKRGDINTALKLYKKSLEINKEIGREWGRLACLGNIANIYSQQAEQNPLDFNKLDKVVSIYDEILTGFEALDANGQNVEMQIGMTYGHLCSFYIQLADKMKSLGLANSDNAINEAKEFLAESKAINDKHDFKENIARDLSYESRICMYEDNMPKAIKLTEESIEIERDILGHQEGLAYDLANLGLLYKETGEYKNSHKASTEAKNIFEDLKMSDLVKRVTANIKDLESLISQSLAS